VVSSTDEEKHLVFPVDELVKVVGAAETHIPHVAKLAGVAVAVILVVIVTFFGIFVGFRIVWVPAEPRVVKALLFSAVASVTVVFGLVEFGLLGR
jgi:hypothetical protein